MGERFGVFVTAAGRTNVQGAVDILEILWLLKVRFVLFRHSVTAEAVKNTAASTFI